MVKETLDYLEDHLVIGYFHDCNIKKLELVHKELCKILKSKKDKVRIIKSVQNVN